MYCLLSTLLQRGDVALKYAIYDNACALARYARHPLRCGRTPAASAIAALTFVIDSFHVANHTACITEGHDFFLPEVRRERHPQLAAVNTQTAEQFFSWADPFVRSTASMTPSVFQAFVLILVHLYNSIVCGDSAAQLRRRPSRRRNTPAAAAPLRPRSRASENEPGHGAAAPPAPVVVLQFRRNPRGVGLWGAGKYHWSPDPGARRPPSLSHSKRCPKPYRSLRRMLTSYRTLALSCISPAPGIRSAAPVLWPHGTPAFSLTEPIFLLLSCDRAS